MLDNEADSAPAEGTDTDIAGSDAPGGVRPPRRRASRPAGPPPDVDDSPAPRVTQPAAPIAEPFAAPVVQAAAAAPVSRPAGPPPEVDDDEPPKKAPRTRTRAAAKSLAEPVVQAAAAAPVSRPAGPPPEVEDDQPPKRTARTRAASEDDEAPKKTTRTRAKAAASDDEAPAKKTTRTRTRAAAADDDEAPAKKTTRTRTRTAAATVSRPAGPPPEVEDEPAQAPEEEAPAKRTRTRTRATAAVPPVPEVPAVAAEDDEDEAAGGVPGVTFQPPMVVFQPPQPTAAPVQPKTKSEPVKAEPVQEAAEPEDELDESGAVSEHDEDDDSDDRPSRRRRRRGGRGRGRGGRELGEDDDAEAADEAGDEPEPQPRKSEKQDRPAKAAKGAKATKAASAKAKAEQAEDADHGDDDDDEGSGTSRRRRRRRRRAGGGEDGAAVTPDDPPNTVVHVRDSRTVEDEVQSVRGSTRLEAKKQRRREGREQGRRRPPVITEAEFLARREAVERVMVVRQEGDRTQIAVLEDDVLVEHYVNRATHQSYVGNVYLGKVQNVLPSMEAAFVDIGKGRNAVLYAGEVNWDVAGLEGQPRRIESALKSGQSVLVQVTKDPLGHKGARLTSQVSLPGRYLVYVPDGSMTGISRKLPDKERSRLKQILKKIMPENAGVIVRTAAEGATEEELSRDVSRLSAQWENIQKKVKGASAPSLLYGEPDLTIRVVRDIFNEDFTKLVVAGEGAWDTVAEYVEYVAPHLADRLERWTGDGDVLGAYRIDEQIAKGLDRKVWLPSGGSLVIDRTEAMTVIDVNTGKFTGQGGNLEETVTRNNLEAAEEIVRQLRLRDIGGIVVIDFIDMVLESNRDLVLRRLVECLSRDRTKHQVAEVTSLGLVQMTRKRVGQGLLEAFSETCEACNGRGIHVHTTPVDLKSDKSAASGEKAGRRRKRKGEVEKAVEDKLARQESVRSDAVDEGDEPVAEEPPAERPARRRGPARRPASAPPELDEDETPAPVTVADDIATTSVAADEAAADAAEAAETVAPGALDPVEADTPALNGSEPDEAAAGRRRRTRRPRAKAETAPTED
ncbi:Rne/Rng family ribonuclease [Spirillospora sp. CA-294931]|uniref:Rne/Rng family ribonuclease n=1 Tax=Spirillospora sp. CA-294931 TaxID=3240042 RepID=UPI003D93D6B0